MIYVRQSPLFYLCEIFGSPTEIKLESYILCCYGTPGSDVIKNKWKKRFLRELYVIGECFYAEIIHQSESSLKIEIGCLVFNTVHGKTMTPIVIIDPCVEIVNPICYYCYQSIKGNYYKNLSIENQFNSSVFKDNICFPPNPLLHPLD